jgi:hypothetical protein
MRKSSLGLAAALIALSPHVARSQNPPTIPTVVAEAMSLEWSWFGKPSFFDGATPTGWPGELVPAGVKVIGGASVGSAGGTLIRVAVFSFGRGTNPDAIIRAQLAANGFRNADEPSTEPQSGFLTTPEAATGAAKYCKGVSLATYAPVDSMRDPHVIAVQLMEGGMALSSCTGRRDRLTTMSAPDPVNVPALSPPPGGQMTSGGSSGGDGERTMHATIIANISADSLLAHYSRLLTRAGWAPNGTVASAGSVATQSFAVTQGKEKWDARLVIVSSGARHQVMLYLMRTG